MGPQVKPPKPNVESLVEMLCVHEIYNVYIFRQTDDIVQSSLTYRFTHTDGWGLHYTLPTNRTQHHRRGP